ncbi:Pvc16 family protein [Geobacter hydrogenophilus]|uniref:Pvc16 N-terminal domain-containing protein n=1 Tax=Geobacter hydrogenophilus TaxID=40983 RepID=A0A9W6FXN2_9BACT|nr:Pvc16 family protein [Geobacter hydrogenophilus]GLI36904.1 hypothetical protein GHYDROH2_04050 [Geobacter hydrogenophilus]
MALPRSSLSQVCRAIADFVSVGLDASANSIQIMIGSPASAAPATTDTSHRVNLFFYRVEPAGFFTGDTPGDPWWVRLHCLVTGFGLDEDKVSAGENDLRLLGEVMRLFHETPVQSALTVVGARGAFRPWGAAERNPMWRTQGAGGTRLRGAPGGAGGGGRPGGPPRDAPGGGGGGGGGAGARARPPPFAGAAAAPPVPRTTVDTSSPDWAPVISFVLDDETCAQSLLFAHGSQELADFTPHVWVAGEPDAPVTLAWQRWTSTIGWEDVPDPTAATATDLTLDPEAAVDAQTVEVTLPAELVSGGGQAVLYAQRSLVRGSDGVTVTVRSNPLLVTVHGGA